MIWVIEIRRGERRSYLMIPAKSRFEAEREAKRKIRRGEKVVYARPRRAA